MEESLQQISKEVARGFSQIAEQSVRSSIEKTEARLDELFKKTEIEIKKIYDYVPVMHVLINQDGDPKKLSTRPASYLPRLIMNAKLNLYTLMIGPAGCGKTTGAQQLAEALSLPFASVCLTAGASETWLFGRQTPTGFVEGSFSSFYKKGGVFLADEIDAADANLLLSINTALSHNTMYNPMSGETIEKHPNFIFVAAANTNGKGSDHLYTGRTRLDAATLDRFIIVTVDYDTQLEDQLCPDHHLSLFLKNVRKALKSQGYDEFISTRAFKFNYSQLQAGVSPEEIIKSMIANWGEAAKKIAEKEMDNIWGKKKAIREPRDDYAGQNYKITIDRYKMGVFSQPELF